MDERVETLQTILRGMPPIAVAVSGGVDSLTLATLAHRTLPGGVTVYHAVSPAVPPEASQRVKDLATQDGWILQIVDAGEFSDSRYRANPVNRCFHCKSHLYDAIARRTQSQIVSGTNLDDLGEYRPGLEAARARAVRHPYVEAEIGKQALRALSRRLGLGAIAELPASPCLSSRVETGIVIEPDILDLVHRIETAVVEATRSATVRCRIRASGMVIELDERSLENLGDATEARLRATAGTYMQAADCHYPLSFEPYRNGSAFLHQPLTEGDVQP